MSLKYIQLIVLSVVFILQYAVEHLYPQQKRLNQWRNERFNLLVGVLNIALAIVPAGFMVKAVNWLAVHHVGLMHQLLTPFWLQMVVAFLALDGWMYAWHRLNHTVPFFWQFHRFHHADQKMNSTTAVRFHTAELLLSYPGKLALCAAFGINYLPLLVYEILFFISIVIHHSNMAITERQDGIYRRVFASPLLHRIHHSVNKEERNTNYGALFSFWDLLFGTRKNRAATTVYFGVDD